MLLTAVVADVYAVFQTLPTSKGRAGEVPGMSPRTVYMGGSMPNRSGHRRRVDATRPYADMAPAASALAAGQPDIPSYCGPIQSGTTPRRRGVFASLGKGFVSTRRGISSTSAPNLGDTWFIGTMA